MNGSPDKIISMAELLDRTKMLLDTHLSPKEKVIAALYDRPVSAWLGVKMGLSLVFNKKSP